jgi:hypothetical protein
VRPVTELEEWRPCPPNPAYQVSNLGRVRRAKTGRVLKPWASDRGYLYVDLSRKCRGRSVHGLVALAFLGDRPVAHDVDHLDWDRRNNAAANLRYLHRLVNAVRWADRTPDGRNVWETPDTPAPDDHEPLTEQERAELDAALEAWGRDATLVGGS